MKKKLSVKMLGIVNLMALLLVSHSANITCVWAFHQPEFPEAAQKFKKRKEI